MFRIRSSGIPSTPLMILGYPGMHGALVDTEIASGVGHGLIRLDGQFDCSLFELGIYGGALSLLMVVTSLR